MAEGAQRRAPRGSSSAATAQLLCLAKVVFGTSPLPCWACLVAQRCDCARLLREGCFSPAASRESPG